MNKEKLKSILTSKIIIGIFCFIVGGIALGNSTEVGVSKERYNQLLELEKVALEKGNESKQIETFNETLSKNNLNDKEIETSEENKTILSIGETIYM